MSIHYQAELMRIKKISDNWILSDVTPYFHELRHVFLKIPGSFQVQRTILSEKPQFLIVMKAKTF